MLLKYIINKYLNLYLNTYFHIKYVVQHMQSKILACFLSVLRVILQIFEVRFGTINNSKFRSLSWDLHVREGRSCHDVYMRINARLLNYSESDVGAGRCGESRLTF